MNALNVLYGVCWCEIVLTYKDNCHHLPGRDNSHGAENEVVYNHLPWVLPRVSEARQCFVRVHLHPSLRSLYASQSAVWHEATACVHNWSIEPLEHTSSYPRIYYNVNNQFVRRRNYTNIMLNWTYGQCCYCLHGLVRVPPVTTHQYFRSQKTAFWIYNFSVQRSVWWRYVKLILDIIRLT